MKKTLYIIIGVAASLIITGMFFFNQNTANVVETSQNEIMAVYASLSPQAKAHYFQQSDELSKPVPERLVELDELKIGCFRPNTILRMSSSDENLGGQCCGTLKNFEAYEIQLDVLEHFIEENGNIDLIPKDPYDIQVEHAQQLISFDSIVLSSGHQIYNAAMQMSHHGGPCCCKCWKWYMMSGLGKKLIVDYNWNAKQLTELWDLSSSCGHEEDTNMHEHYKTNDEHAL